MQQLLGFSDSIVVLPTVSEGTESTQTIVEQLDKFLRQLAITLNKNIEQVAVSVKKIETHNSHETDISNQIEVLTQKVEILTQQFEQLAQSVKKIESFINQLSEVEPGRLVTVDNKINLNTIQTAQELERYKVPEIGIKTAEAIIRLRERKGKFQSLTELMEVKGITQRKLKVFDTYLFCE
ncbi:helix-hairpin-helix domain-containing protein [Nostoc sp. BAE]|nr:helix-hairpin-helix domain-containing protein [Nostoc commune BAE]